MPIVGIVLGALLFAGFGAVVGGAIGAGAIWLLHLRQVRRLEAEGAEVRPEDISSGCGVFLMGAVLGSVFGGGILPILGFIVLRSLD